MAKRKKTQAVTSSGIYRQGDVLIQRIDAAPAKGTSDIERENGRAVLAHGEVTGHAHALRNPNVCFLRSEGTTDRFLIVGADGGLVEHDEHDAIALSPGKYRIRIQREYDGATSRRVED